MLVSLSATVIAGMVYNKKDDKGNQTNELGLMLYLLYDNEDVSKNPLAGTVTLAYGAKSLCADPVKLDYIRKLPRYSTVTIKADVPVGQKGAFMIKDIRLPAPKPELTPADDEDLPF